MEQNQVGVKTPEYVSLQFQLAGLGSRTAAFIIDQLILMAVQIVLIIGLVVLTSGDSAWFTYFDVGSIAFAITIIAVFMINWGYFIVFEFVSGGRTIGKRLIGIRVIQENGHSITFLSSLIRNLLRIIDSLPTSYLLGIIMIFFHSKHKRIGDLVAGTIVVHERKAKRKKLSPLEKEMEARGLSKDDLVVDEWTLQSLDKKDWELLKTYSQRLLQLPINERQDLTQQIATILFTKLNWETGQKNTRELENMLLILYLQLKEEWEYEL
ncbi:RDD family protein [Bacillus sp. FJAT-50079]|uniref:RDD family protein n=1 Tax=Bacillus sp. FJAT-50079 TaxID=2833577 RepID=UPI001BC9D9AF|nr:RDD family protein [Bacillus sp. FJAT-50079]MBS4208024.1 RDD family protein [Bacillus sp. FJAT-50079]